HWSLTQGGPGGAGIPVNGDNAVVRATSSISMNFDGAYGVPGLNALDLHATNGVTFTMNQSQNPMLATVEQIGGIGGNCVYHQTGGTHTMTGTLFIATNAGSTGEYQLDGGTLNVSGNIENNGLMTQSPGGTLNLGGTVIGNGIIHTNGPASLADQTNI